MRKLLILILVLLLSGCTATVPEMAEGYGPGEEGFVTTPDYTDPERPPTLHLTTETESLKSLPAGYSWQYVRSDGTTSNQEVEAPQPALNTEAPMLKTSDREMMLIFGEMPDELTVRCWKADGYFVDAAAQAQEVPVCGQSIRLQEGTWLYEVLCVWNADARYSGTASYCFLVEAQ